MALVKCKNCKHKISDTTMYCIHCGEEVSTVTLCSECNEEIEAKDTVCLNCGYEKPYNVDIKTEKTISFLSKYATFLKIIAFIAAGIILIWGFALIDDSDGMSLLIGILSAIGLIIAGIIQEAVMNWFAMMLKNTYEIKKNTK